MDTEPAISLCGSNYVSRASDEVVSGGMIHEADRAVIGSLGSTDFVLLYFMLVADNVLPRGFLADFTKLEGPARRSTERSQNLLRAFPTPKLLLSSQKQKLQESLSGSSAADQLVVAASLRPKRFTSKWQQCCFEGPTARKDAEASQRIRWISLLADLLRNTGTPMGRLIRESPSNIQLLGCGLRAVTLRSRVRAAQKFLGWLAAAHNVAFPVHWKQLVEYLQVRLSELCVRGALKATHRSFLFLQEAARVSEKLYGFGSKTMYRKKGVTRNCATGEPSRASPALSYDTSCGIRGQRSFRQMLLYFGVCCLGGCCSSPGRRFRFDDHRGIMLKTEMKVMNSGLWTED